ncbi:Sfi1-domain-containing protein [Stipitochalara longipes BDJ]|nr:Sfi1-domain-containing protein [Stipitochalara longipes BDJ]
MPPPGSHPQSNAGQDITGTGEPYYSNEDVAILHDIVVLAQELLPKLPERERLPTNALFSAYYDILPRIGINADHDSRYARVLFKIGGLRGQGTLYEKFEEILSRMGIEIEFDHEGDEEQYSQLEDSQYSLDIARADELLAQEENEHRTRRPRRNSESSAWDGGNDPQSQLRKRRNSASSITKVSQANSHQNTLQEARSPYQQLPLRTANLQNQKEDGPEHNVGTWLSSRPDKSRRGRNRSISTHGSMRIRRRSLSLARRDLHQSAINPSIPASDDFNSPSEVTAVTSGLGDDTASELAIPSQRCLSDQDAEGLMQIKASLILQYNLNSLVKRQLRVWKDRALYLREESTRLESVAIDHDKKALLQSALDSWRLLSLQKRQAAETERFFAHIERRAARARDLYLMHVAFTHWSTYASEQVQRTALARRHIVRTRIFNAWRDITAVNELKVRRQVLKKFFTLWKHRNAVTSANVNLALQKYEGNLVEKLYKQWIEKLWTVRAIAWWADGIKRRTLFRWIVVSHRSWEAHRNADDKRRLQLSWRAWRTWRIKVEAQVQRTQEADHHHRNHIRLVSLRKWRHETRMVPAKITVQTNISSRILREAFNIWLHRTRQERSAVAIDRMKILKEALTNWQYRSRTTLVRTRVDHNSKTTAIFRWIIAKRCSERRRNIDKELLGECFHVWIQKMRLARAKTSHQQALSQSFMLQRSQDIVFRLWFSRMDARRRLEAAAPDLRTPQLLGSIVSRWVEQSQHLRQLETWARDANFYFLATKAVNRWRISTDASKRDKRKTAYAQVRRTAKITLARGVLRTWRDKAKYASGLDSRAREMSYNRNIIIGMDIFDRWRARTEELAELESIWRGSVLKKHFTVWKARSNALQAYSLEAILTYKEHRQSRTIKKWSLLSLQLRAQTNYAADICEKNSKRTFRKMFTYWHQKAAQQRPKREVKIPQQAITSRQLGTTTRAEAWSEFGDDLQIDEWAKGVDEATVAAPIPGYLSTPSKRTERVMAVAAKFSTTPKAPLSTPFERHLRAQWSGGLLPPLRKDRGKSTLSMGGGFEDIVEGNVNIDLKQGEQGE